MGKVQVFKMLTSEEVVAEASASFIGSKEVYTLRRPHTLQFQQIAPGQIGLAFVPWALSNPTIENMEVPASALLIPPFDPDPKVERQYLEQTSGISLSAGAVPSKFVKG
jgi:hypothetical protein